MTQILPGAAVLLDVVFESAKEFSVLNHLDEKLFYSAQADNDLLTIIVLSIVINMSTVSCCPLLEATVKTIIIEKNDSKWPAGILMKCFQNMQQCN